MNAINTGGGTPRSVTWDSQRASCVIFVLLAFSACSGPAPRSSLECFRNEFPIDGSKDVQELLVSIEGDRVRGEYNWLPAFKDTRLGRFSGTIQNSLIEAVYDYRQEGQTGTTSIAISLEADKAVITGGPPELGLNLTLQRVAC